MTSTRPLRDFIQDMTTLADLGLGEVDLLSKSRPLMQQLLAKDEWLPSAFAEPNERSYRQYLLYCDPRERFSLVSFVWGPGQETPVHDHTVWGMIGVLRGSEISQRYEWGDGLLHQTGSAEVLESGAIDVVSPTVGDIHKVRNGLKSRASVSLHLYGGNIGAIDRHAFAADGQIKSFRSGYSSDVVPNVW